MLMVREFKLSQFILGCLFDNSVSFNELYVHSIAMNDTMANRTILCSQFCERTMVIRID